MARKTKVEEAPAKKKRGAKDAADEKPARKRKAAEEEAPAKKKKRGAKVEETPAKGKRSKKAEAEEPVKKSRRSKKVVDEDESEEEAPPARKGKKKAAAEAVETAFNPYASLDATLDAIEKHIGLTDSSMDKSEKRMSTGMLVQDIILGGGLTAGWYTNFGFEQCCKTTNAVTMLVMSVNAGVPIIGYWDYEGSATPDYIENIMRNMGLRSDVKSLFGVRDEKSGGWLVPPRVRYKSEGVAEKFFDYLAQMLRKLPDKKKIGDNWYYIYEGKRPDGSGHKENAKIVGDKYDKNYFRKTGNYRIPAPDGQLQGIILVDSYPAMLPEVLDVDDPNSAVGAQARMFSTQIKRVKGRMKAKRVAVIGINQLRLRPMAMGNPEYETCGEALKLFSDVRLKHTSHSLSSVSKFMHETIKGKGQIEEEPSVTYKKGRDNYRYIHIRAHKNKLSRPYLEGYMRLWITDGKGVAQGFDPVFDTYMYLKMTGQLSGKRAKMTLKLKGNEAKKSIGWLDFKRLVLGDKATIRDICEMIGMKPCKIRDKCFDQMAAGKGIEYFNDHNLNGSDDDEEDEDILEGGEDGDDEN